jgi:hypothetical protein
LHPDKIKLQHSTYTHAQISELFLLIHRAYEILSNKLKRDAYDVYGYIGVQAVEALHMDINYRNQQTIKKLIQQRVHSLTSQKQKQKQNETFKSISFEPSTTSISYAYNLFSLFGYTSSSSRLKLFSLPSEQEIDELTLNGNLHYQLPIYKSMYTNIQHLCNVKYHDKLVITYGLNVKRIPHTIQYKLIMGLQYQFTPSISFACNVSLGKNAQIKPSITYKINDTTEINLSSNLHMKLLTDRNLKSFMFHNTRIGLTRQFNQTTQVHMDVDERSATLSGATKVNKKLQILNVLLCCYCF